MSKEKDGLSEWIYVASFLDHRRALRTADLKRCVATFGENVYYGTCKRNWKQSGVGLLCTFISTVVMTSSISLKKKNKEYKTKIKWPWKHTSLGTSFSSPVSCLDILYSDIHFIFISWTSIWQTVHAVTCRSSLFTSVGYSREDP